LTSHFIFPSTVQYSKDNQLVKDSNVFRTQSLYWQLVFLSKCGVKRVKLTEQVFKIQSRAFPVKAWAQHVSNSLCKEPQMQNIFSIRKLTWCEIYGSPSCTRLIYRITKRNRGCQIYLYQARLQLFASLETHGLMTPKAALPTSLQEHFHNVAGKILPLHSPKPTLNPSPCNAWISSGMTFKYYRIPASQKTDTMRFR